MIPGFLWAYAGWGMVALRLAVGAVFIVHGLKKVARPSGIANAVWGGRIVVALLQGLVETFGGLALVAGVLTGWAGLVLAIIMLGALYYKIVKWKVPFMATNGTGWEFDLVLLAGLLAIVVG